MAKSMNRRRFNQLAIALGCAPWVPAAVTGTTLAAGPWDRKFSPNEKSPAELVTPETKRTIDRALAFLKQRQVKSGRNRGAFGNSGLSAGVATCSLGGLAFMCAGHAPGFGPYGKTIDLCVEYILKNTRQDGAQAGYIALRDNSNENMYGHGFSMLFLSQAYGMTQKAEIGEKLRQAVKLTCNIQNREGGWRYQPRKSDADLSITVCQIMGLRGARCGY